MFNKIFKNSFFTYLFFYPLIPTNTHIPIGDSLMCLYIVLFMVKSFSSEKERKTFLFRVKDLIKDKIVITMMLSIIIMMISTFYASNKTIAITESVRYFSYVILYIGIKYEFNIKKNFNKFKLLFTIQSGWVFIFGVLQYLTGIGVNTVVDTEGVVRMEGSLGHPNSLAAYIILLIFPLIFFLINEEKNKNKVIYFVIISMGILDLVLSWSRNAWLALVVGFVILAIVYNYKFLYGIFGGGIVAVIIPFIRTRLLQLTSHAINDGRIKLWKAALKMVKDHPIRGIGNGNFSYLYDTYAQMYPELYAEGHSGFPTHNSYLKMWCEIGTIGMLIFFSTYVICGVKLFIINKKYKNKYSGFTTAVLASFGAFMFSNLFDNLLFLPKVTTIFICLVSLCITVDAKERSI